MKNNRRGDAMITVLCVMFLFLAISLAALFAAASLGNSSTQNAEYARCRVAAVSFSEVLEGELTAEGSTADGGADTSDAEPAEGISGTAGNEFQKAMVSLLRSDTDTDADMSHCWVQDEPGDKWDYGTVTTVGASEENSEDGYAISLSVYWGDSGSSLEDQKNADHDDEQGLYNGTYLYLSVCCTGRTQSYTVLRKYLIHVEKAGAEENPDTGENPDAGTYVWSFSAS